MPVEIYASDAVLVTIGWRGCKVFQEFAWRSKMERIVPFRGVERTPPRGHVDGAAVAGTGSLSAAARRLNGLAPAPLDQKMRDDVGELTGMPKSNLEKVVQHRPQPIGS
jgi:hypothetical protein